MQACAKKSQSCAAQGRCLGEETALNYRQLLRCEMPAADVCVRPSSAARAAGSRQPRQPVDFEPYFSVRIASRASGGPDKSFIIDRFASRRRLRAGASDRAAGRRGRGTWFVMADRRRGRGEAPLPDRRDERRRRRRRRGGRHAVRDVVLSERAREGRGRAGRESTSARSSRARRSTSNGAARSSGSSIARSRCSRRCRSSTRGSPIRTPNVPQQPPYCKNEHRSIKDNVLVAGRHLHAPRLLAHVPARGRAGRPGPRLARRLLLPVPPVEVRPRGPRLFRRAGADQPAGAAAQVPDATPGSSSAKTARRRKGPRPCKSS